MDVRIPYCKAFDIGEEAPVEWLIEDLWLKDACGIIGGQPKCCKSWLGLDMAFSVASGTPCLGTYPVKKQGCALVFLAEDRAANVRHRLSEIAMSRKKSLKDLPIYVLTPPQMFLDREADSSAFEEIISKLCPTFVLLDPLVRLHQLDENNARDIAGFLSFIRMLEKKYQTSIALTHHANKRGGSRPGQGLRGSSDLHAFGDSNLYISRKDDVLTIHVEHRSASAPDPFHLKLQDTPSLHLSPTEKPKKDGKKERNLKDEVLASLSLETPIAQKTLREVLKIKNQTLSAILATFIEEKKVARTPRGLLLLEN